MKHLLKKRPPTGVAEHEILNSSHVVVFRHAADLVLGAPWRRRYRLGHSVGREQLISTELQGFVLLREEHVGHREELVRIRLSDARRWLLIWRQRPAVRRVRDSAIDQHE